MGPKEHSGEYCGLSFCLIYPKRVAKGSSNLETLVGTYQKKPPALTRQGTRKGARQKLLDNSFSTPDKHHRKICGYTLMHISKSQVGSLGSHPHKALMGRSNTQGGWYKTSQVGSQEFDPHWPVTSTPTPHDINRDHIGQLNLDPHIYPPSRWGGVKGGLMESQDLITLSNMVLNVYRENI